MSETLIIALGSIVVISLFCQWLAWWVRLPAILFLLLCGILIGPVFGWLQPDKIFTNLLTPLVEISVAVILFEGSLSLNFSNIQGHLTVVGNLLSIGVLITCVTSTFLAHWLFNLPYNIAILFAVIICVSGPTVITPILRTVKPKANLANILHWESIIIDPIGALLAVLVFNFVTVYFLHTSLYEFLWLFLLRITVSALIGIGVGCFCGIVLRRHWLPEYLQNVGVLAFVLLAFALGNYFEDGSGLLSVTLMGILVANMKDVHIDDILDFKESLSILLISGTFLILAARINFHNLHSVLWPAIIFIIALQFVVRPLSVFFCTLTATLTVKEKILLAWICPRGIVAAAISAIFAIRLQQYHILGNDSLVLLTFLVIIGTVVFQSLTAKPLAKLLGLSTENNQGFLIIGANPIARNIAKVLQENHFRVLLCSLTWDNAQAARMEGLPVFYGNPVSSYADRHLDLIGLDSMLALTARPNLNALSALRFKREFGIDNIFSIQTKHNENTLDEKQTAPMQIKNNRLFHKGITYSHLNRLLKQGAEIKSTKLSEKFNVERYQAINPNAITLFALDDKKHIHFFNMNNEITPNKDWQVISLHPKQTGG